MTGACVFGQGQRPTEPNSDSAADAKKDVSDRKAKVILIRDQNVLDAGDDPGEELDDIIPSAG